MQVYDYQVSDYYVSYKFFSYDAPGEIAGLKGSFRIECAYDMYCLHDFPAFFVNTITYEQVSVEEGVYCYEMKYNGRKIMDITFYIHAPYGEEETLNKAINLLSNNTVFIK